MKILITIGSMKECKFTRLFDIIEELCREGVFDGDELIAQVGFDNYKSQYFKTFDMIPDDDFKSMITDSDYVIAHSGTGTVMSCLKMNKKVIVFPRMKKYEEHFDDHQLELCGILERDNYVLVAKNKNELREHVLNITDFKPHTFKSNNTKINKIIIDFIEDKG